MKTAKIFLNGRSQAVRLPVEFRFSGSEVFIRRDERSGDVILSERPHWSSWEDYFRARKPENVPENFMADRGDGPPQERDLF